jgi:hypothetical protein
MGFGSVDHVLAGHASDVWARSANELALHQGSSTAGLRHGPGKVFSSLTTSYHEYFVSIKHVFIPAQIEIVNQESTALSFFIATKERSEMSRVS